MICACGCERLVLGRGRFATEACRKASRNTQWTPERKAARMRQQAAGLLKEADRILNHQTKASVNMRFL